jgi:NRPS condensation-like uncharacterized protein
MEHKTTFEAYERKITGAERFFSHSPFSTVTMVARIIGNVTGDMLKDAVKKVQQRHALLRVRVKEGHADEQWFTSEDVHEIPIQVIPRVTENDWVKIHADGAKNSYEFVTRPAIRFILVQSPDVSEIIILCHHMICDGMSLAYLARDLMVHLGDPTIEARILPAPEPISLQNLPREVAPSGLIKFFIKRIRQKWADEFISFDQQDYEAINEAYWDTYHHEVLSVELSKDETAGLVSRCKKEGVTVNTAIITAFSGAQNAVTGRKPHHENTAIAVSLRDHLPYNPEKGLGYYASGIEVKYDYDQEKGFWENARTYHKKIGKDVSDSKKIFGNLPSYLQMNSNIYEALTFKKLGALVKPDSPRYDKLHSFSVREDVVVRLLQRAKMETLDAKLLGAAITNLGRLDFPNNYGELELDRLIMQPGGAFPLVHVDMVLGVATCAGKLSLVVEYAEEAVDTLTMQKIKEKAMELLLQ